MSNGLSYGVEATKSRLDVVAVPKDLLEYLAPIVAARDYSKQVHEISILNSGVDRPSSQPIFLLAFHPSFAHVWWNPLPNPF